MTSLPDKEKLVHNFSRCLNLEEKYLYVIELGARLPILNNTQRQSHNLISGCQSLVWIILRGDNKGHIKFYGDSDAVIVKGLLSIVFILYHSLTPQQIIDLNVLPFFSELALSQYLTPSRSLGVEAIIRAIRHKAMRLLVNN